MDRSYAEPILTSLLVLALHSVMFSTFSHAWMAINMLVVVTHGTRCSKTRAMLGVLALDFMLHVAGRQLARYDAVCRALTNNDAARLVLTNIHCAGQRVSVQHREVAMGASGNHDFRMHQNFWKHKLSQIESALDSIFSTSTHNRHQTWLSLLERRDRRCQMALPIRRIHI